MKIKKMTTLLRTYVREILKESPERRQEFAKELGILVPDGSREDVKGAWRGDAESYKKMTQLARPLKRAFAKTADQSWLKTLKTVHYVGGTRQLIDLLKANTRDELSAIAYLPGEFTPGTHLYGEAAVVVSGRITLLANDMDDLMSGSGALYRQHDSERAKSSGANKGVSRRYPAKTYADIPILVLDQEDWKPAQSSGSGSDRTNEALVDNWKIEAIIVPEKSANDVWNVAKWENIVEKLNLDVPVMTHSEAVGLI